MAAKYVRYEERGPVAVITYDRQERRNAWSVAMYREAVAAVERANASAPIGAVVLTNAGPAFCAGVDLKERQEPADPQTGRSPNIGTLSMEQDHSWVHLMARSKPVIAAVDGAAVGAGVTQILPADIRVASARSSFWFPFVQHGFLPEIGCTALLPRIVGLGRALDICLSAATLNATEALRIGLISHIVEDGQLLETALKLAGRIASFPRLQVRLTKDLLHRNPLEPDPNVFLARETEAFVTIHKAARAAKTHKAAS